MEKFTTLVISANHFAAERGGGRLTVVVLVVVASLGEAVLALRSWAACDVGVNAGANLISMVFVGLPLLFT
jgi:hypothetical protein